MIMNTKGTTYEVKQYFTLVRLYFSLFNICVTFKNKIYTYVPDCMHDSFLTVEI